MTDLTDRVALITGAARGQGAAEAELLARHGARVMVTDVLADEGRAVANRVPGAAYHQLDVGDDVSWQKTVEATITRFGRLDVLVNNAAISHFGPIAETSAADFVRVIQINLLGVYLGMRAAFPFLKRNGGSIINISSIAGLEGRANLAPYAASKWGVRGLSKSAAVEFGPHRIRVNTILPGLIDTPMTRNAYGAEKLAARGASLPAARAGQPSDVANLVLFLASDSSAFCTGAEFVCDGGETAGR